MGRVKVLWTTATEIAVIERRWYGRSKLTVWRLGKYTYPNGSQALLWVDPSTGDVLDRSSKIAVLHLTLGANYEAPDNPRRTDDDNGPLRF